MAQLLQCQQKPSPTLLYNIQRIFILSARYFHYWNNTLIFVNCDDASLFNPARLLEGSKWQSTNAEIVQIEHSQESDKNKDNIRNGYRLNTKKLK
jgi:hypothetical protein